jgi:hypothetical protein
MHKTKKEGFVALCCTLYNIPALSADSRLSICGTTLRKAPGVSKALSIRREHAELMMICTNQQTRDFGIVLYIIQHNSIVRRCSVVNVQKGTEGSVENTLNEDSLCRTHWPMHKSMRERFLPFCHALYNIIEPNADI